MCPSIGQRYKEIHHNNLAFVRRYSRVRWYKGWRWESLVLFDQIRKPQQYVLVHSNRSGSDYSYLRVTQSDSSHCGEQTYSNFGPLSPSGRSPIIVTAVSQNDESPCWGCKLMGTAVATVSHLLAVTLIPIIQQGSPIYHRLLHKTQVV